MLVHSGLLVFNQPVSPLWSLLSCLEKLGKIDVHLSPVSGVMVNMLLMITFFPFRFIIYLERTYFSKYILYLFQLRVISSFILDHGCFQVDNSVETKRIVPNVILVNQSSIWKGITRLRNAQIVSAAWPDLCLLYRWESDSIAPFFLHDPRLTCISW